ncbi:hypothetical protein THMIRHAS_14120 [Thiosulfatimonas sediminis]|uniref:Succinate dehydrogenase hydrophobic membrane anchor subunit n=1 Tax=Thiosulfatimonas sediminis TaxID=2675054 RepID=A0A6F8PV97_9GAMM|nr:succinate dehydrogenase, hydrophobic membrane anchor protein [Thiosulfatimonas sediminis]BBP46039.1 hypothetical protein THMIRHAS_14120 [Thiosulfatimonas sediminis]
MIRLQKLSGAKAHRWQRISAWYLLLYLPALAIYISLVPQHNSLANIIGNLYYCTFGIASLLALLLVFIHAWVGGRDVLIDYTPRSNTYLWLTAYFAFLLLLAANLTLLVLAFNPIF